MARTSKQEAKEQLWRQGVLLWKLDSSQKELYKLFYETNFKVQTWLLARRSGKSYALCVLAIEQCLKAPNCIVKFASPTKIQVNNNLRPILRQILEDCPEDIKPEFSGKDYIYYFKNGSEIQLAGTDSGHAEKLRGGSSTISIVDEAQDCSGLINLVRSILLPTTLTTNGKIILAGTPPKETDHEFLSYIEEAEDRGSIIKKTVFDNSRLTKKQIEDFIEEVGGITSDECRRELLCEVIKDPKSSVIPEFTKELEKEIIKEWPKPPHYDCYEGMDLGFEDFTAVIFGYFDFRANKIIIEDELVLDFRIPETNIEKLVKNIEEKEKQHWYNHLTNEQKEVCKRVSDHNGIVLREIGKYSNYKIMFTNADKYDNEASINYLREKFQKRQIIIHPRCVTLIRHLRNVKWKGGQRAIFARSPDDGHYDTVEALKYMIRSIDVRKNPYPAHYGRDMTDLYIENKNKFNGHGNQMEAYKKIFNVKKTGR